MEEYEIVDEEELIYEINVSEPNVLACMDEEACYTDTLPHIPAPKLITPFEPRKKKLFCDSCGRYIYE